MTTVFKVNIFASFQLYLDFPTSYFTSLDSGYVRHVCVQIQFRKIGHFSEALAYTCTDDIIDNQICASGLFSA